MMRVTTRAQLAIAFGLGISLLGLFPVFLPGLRPGGLAGTLLAQNAPPRPGPAARNLAADGRNDDDLAIDGVFLPPDRASKRRLENAQQLLAEGRSGEAVRLLSAVLEASEDYFFKPNPDQPVYRSLKAEAGRVLGSLSGEARQAYELQSGARARQMLKQSAASGNLNELAEVSRRYFSTQAGWEATFLLGRKHLDENRPLAAAMCFERLCDVREAQSRLDPALSLSLAAAWVRADRPARAKEALARLKRTYPKSEITVAGKPVKLFASAELALAWFDTTFGHQQPRESGADDSWTLARGDETRNAASRGGRPLLNLRWRQRTADDRAVEKFVGKLRQDLQSQDAVAMPSFQPLAIDDVVLMRTAFATQAVDFATGKLVWKYPSADDSLEQFLKVGSQPQQGQSVQLFSGLAQRMWDDAVYGTMASDGANVYFVDDLGLGLVGSPGATIMHNGRRANLNTNPRSTNVLAARELKTQGKLRWQVGGATGEDEPKLAGAFFLGPPLPLSGQLYAMAEMKGQEIRLVALSAETGALQWSQQLAVVEQSVAADSMRRNAGATPSFADGVLVCPTSAGAIVGFDLATRSLLWGYQYPRFQGVPDRFNAVRFGVHNAQERQAGEHWADSMVTLADGRALVTPVESDQIYCLNLADGRELWKHDRGNHLYVACVHRGRVILVGRNRVSAVELADGRPAWPDLDLPPSSLPSGRGFYSGDSYYLPLSSAEVVAISLDEGRITDRARSRSGIVPGNLICHRGNVVSQSVDGVEAYYQLDALKRDIDRTLAEHPDDAKALASAAELKLDEGALAEAAALFRRSLSIKPDDTTREQLIETLLESLRVDFAGNRDHLAELDGLIEREEHRLAYLRLMADGLQSAGEAQPAFEAYLKLLDHAPPDALDSLDAAHAVRRDRWIASQLEQLRQSAPAATLARMDAETKTRLDAALASGTPEALRSFLAVFGNRPSAVAARMALAARLDDTDLVELEATIRSLGQTAGAESMAPLVARLARTLESTGRPDLAAVYYRELSTRFANVVAHDGQTGSQLYEKLPADGPVRKALAAHGAWPQGKVNSRERDAQPRPTQARAQRPVELELTGAKDPLFGDMTLLVDPQSPGWLIGQDGLGERRFRVAFGNPSGRSMALNRFNAYSAPPLMQLSAAGGLLVLSMSNQVVAIDTLRVPDARAGRILWSQDLNESVGGMPANQSIYSRPIPVAWGGTRYVPEDTAGRRYATMGPVISSGVTFQRLRDLYCVDPLTGKTLWVRKNVGLGNQLFGDGELLLVAPPGDADTLVLRAATGELLGTRRIVSFEKRMTTIGRQVLTWESEPGGFAVRLRDPWEEKIVWSHSFAAGAKAALAGQDALGVFEPDGDFVLIKLADGKPMVSEKLEPEGTLAGITLSADHDRYLLITNSGLRNEQNLNVQPLPNSGNSPFVNGRVYAFSTETGKSAWPAPVVIAQYGMLAAQPKNLPVLVFVRQVSKPGALPNRENHTSVLCIDKRSGRVVYENDQLPAPTLLGAELVGDGVTHTISLTVGAKTIELQFTDEAIESPAGAAQLPGPRTVGLVRLEPMTRKSRP